MPDSSNADQTTDPGEQLASPLFGKLPLELRLAIFTELFGERKLHLTFLSPPAYNDPIKGKRPDPAGNRRRRRCFRGWRDPTSAPLCRILARGHCRVTGERRALAVSLLLTCRRALVLHRCHHVESNS